MKTTIRNATVFVLAILMVLVLLPSFDVFAASDKTTLEEDRDELIRKQEEYEKAVANRNNAKKELAALTEQISAVEKDKRAVEVEIVYIDSQIEALDSLVGAYEPIVASLKNEIDELSKKQELYMSRYSDIVRYSFMEGDASVFEIIFNSESISDFLTRLDFSANILEYSASLTKSIEENKAEIEQSRADYDNAINALSGLKDEQVLLRQEQVDGLAQLEVLQTKYEAEQEKVNSYVSNMASELDDIQKDIAKIEETIKQKEYVAGDWSRPLPTKWKRISSPWGWRYVFGEKDFHKGIDFPCDTGTEVYAVCAGTVVMSEYRGGYGWLVVIYHGGGIKTYYAHNSKLLVKVGQEVDEGQLISLSGNTGKSTGPHLHFGVMVDNEFVDPETKDENGKFMYLDTTSFPNRSR